MKSRKSKLKTTFERNTRKLRNENNGQIIVLMGALMVIFIIFLSTIAPHLANIGIAVTGGKASSLIQDFKYIKETFPYALNYNLAENITKKNDDLIIKGNMNNITRAFNQTRGQFYNLSLQNGILFEIILNDYWVAHPGSPDCLYYLNVTLSLFDRDEYLSENTIYSIICKPVK